MDTIAYWRQLLERHQERIDALLDVGAEVQDSDDPSRLALEREFQIVALCERRLEELLRGTQKNGKE